MDRKLLNVRLKVSAKQHQCSLCIHAIPIGTKYSIFTSVEGYRMFSFLMCNVCCQEIKYIQQACGEDISKQFNMCIDKANITEKKQILTQNKKILYDYINKYCIGKLGDSIDEIRYNIDHNLIDKEGE